MDLRYKQINDSVWSYGDSLFMPGPNWSLGNALFLPGQIGDTALFKPVYIFSLDSAIQKASYSVSFSLSPSETTQFVPSLITPSPYQHALKEPIGVNHSSHLPAILSTFILLSFMLFVLSRVVEWNRIPLFLKSIYNTKALHRFIEAFEAPLAPPVPILYMAANFIISGFVLANYAESYMYGSVGYAITVSIIVTLLVTILPLIRASFIRLLGSIFELETYAGIHVYISYCSQMIFAILTLPFFLNQALSLDFIPAHLNHYVSLIIGIVLIYQYIRVFNTFPVRGIISIFYIILYLCTLELLPLLILFKLFEQI